MTASSLATGQAAGDLLKEPAVAIGVAEGCERRVAAPLGIRSRHAARRRGRVEAGSSDGAVLVVHLADLGAALDELGPRGCDVVDDQVKALRRAGGGGG